jgi:hypothetical protein
MSEKAPYSWATVISPFFALLMCVSVGALGLVFGIVGLRRTRGGRRRGKVAAQFGAVFGGISLLVTITAIPTTFLQPPVIPPGPQLQGFLDDVTAGRIEQAYRHPVIHATNSPLEEFRYWAEHVNADYGRGRVIWCESRLNWTDAVATYWVHFEKVGVRTVTLWGGSSGTWALMFGPDDAPDVWLREREQEEELRALSQE